MSSTTVRQQEEYQHLTQVVWLDANNDVLLLLRGENKTNLRGMRSVMRRPRLQQTTFVNADGESKNLSDVQIDELRAIDSFWNYLQNWHGPPAIAGNVDITTATREDFLTFIGRHGDLENNPDPVLEDNDLMIRSYALRTQSQSNNSNNNRTRSNSPRSSRSTSPTVRRVTNHLLVQFLKKKRPLTDYSMLLEDIMQWPEWDRQLDALAHAHMVWKRYLSTSTLRHQDQMRRRYGRRCRFICTTYSSNLLRRQKVYVSSRNIRPIGTHRPYTRSCVTTTLARHRRWQLPTSMRWRIAL